MTRKFLALLVVALFMSVLTIEAAAAAPIAGKVTLKITCDRGWTTQEPVLVQMYDSNGDPIASAAATISCGGKAARAVVSAPGALYGTASPWQPVGPDGTGYGCSGQSVVVNDPDGETCPPGGGVTLFATARR